MRGQTMTEAAQGRGNGPVADPMDPYSAKLAQMPLLHSVSESLGAHNEISQETISILRGLRDRLFGPQPEAGGQTGNAARAPPPCIAEQLRSQHHLLSNRLSEIISLVREIESGL